MNIPNLPALAAQARQALEQGRMADAERVYRELLRLAPDAGEPRKVLAALALTRKEAHAAQALLLPWAEGQDDAEAWKLVGQADLLLGDDAGAVDALQRSVALQPTHWLTWLLLGDVHRQARRDYQALVATFRAINGAQRQGQWLNDATTPVSLRPRLKAAMDFVDAGRERLLTHVLEPLVARYGEQSLARVRKCVRIYVGREPAVYGDPWQRPGFLFFPDLPTPAFHPRELFPWMDALEAGTDVIRAEMQAVLAADSGFEPFRRFTSEQEEAGYLRGHRGKPAWDAYFFWRHGERFDDNHARCPRTSAILEGLPLVRIDKHAPEILFSVLTPGSHILPHRGVTNTRLVSHLPLVVPPDCAIRVGDETRVWREGEAFAFDDTFEHEAWNRSDQTRVVLLVDAWNPYLTEVERAAVHDLVLAIGELHHDCGIA
jgi:aspartate beta-hydroxylase